MILDFLAFDFETADAKNTAPCSLGVTVVKNGIVEYTHNYLINPQCAFSAYSSSVHGLSMADVSDSPIFPAVWQEVSPLFSSLPVVAHNISFDRSVLEKACDRYDLPIPQLAEYDTYSLAVELLPDATSYRLSALCAYFNIDLPREHHSGYDSAAAANLFLAIQSLYPDRIHPIDPFYSTPRPQNHSFSSSRSAVYMQAGVEFDDVPISFAGQSFVITGDVDGYSREDVQTAIRNAGGKIQSSVSKKTNYLVIGRQDVTIVKDKDHAKGTKILKAEQLRSEGCEINFVSAEKVIAALDAFRSNQIDPCKVYTSNDIFEIIKNAISPQYAACTNLELRQGSSFDSVVITYPASVYHPSGSVTLARINLTGTQLYVSFPPRAESILRSLNIPLSFAHSDPWPRVIPLEIIVRADAFKEKIDSIFLGALNFPTFGCCSKYEACSVAKRCLHNDLIYAASACEYKRHLESGRIFYGKNKNIE